MHETLLWCKLWIFRTCGGDEKYKLIFMENCSKWSLPKKILEESSFVVFVNVRSLCVHLCLNREYHRYRPCTQRRCHTRVGRLSFWDDFEGRRLLWTKTPGRDPRRIPFDPQAVFQTNRVQVQTRFQCNSIEGTIVAPCCDW